MTEEVQARGYRLPAWLFGMVLTFGLLGVADGGVLGLTRLETMLATLFACIACVFWYLIERHQVKS